MYSKFILFIILYNNAVIMKLIKMRIEYPIVVS